MHCLNLAVIRDGTQGSTCLTGLSTATSEEAKRLVAASGSGAHCSPLSLLPGAPNPASHPLLLAGVPGVVLAGAVPIGLGVNRVTGGTRTAAGDRHGAGGMSHFGAPAGKRQY